MAYDPERAARQAEATLYCPYANYKYGNMNFDGITTLDYDDVVEDYERFGQFRDNYHYINTEEEDDDEAPPQNDVPMTLEQPMGVGDMEDVY